MKADIGVFGGSGFYSFLENIEEVEIDTPYGKPSDKISIASYKGKKIAFLPRHGKAHAIPTPSYKFQGKPSCYERAGGEKNNSSDCFRQFTGTYKTR
jgi:5'-methylthioadenosine phosphorylase